MRNFIGLNRFKFCLVFERKVSAPLKNQALASLQHLPCREILRIENPTAKNERSVMDFIWLIPFLLLVAVLFWRGFRKSKVETDEPLNPPQGRI
jgi:hypothetical protein